jgi:hypothetical protein
MKMSDSSRRRRSYAPEVQAEIARSYEIAQTRQEKEELAAKHGFSSVAALYNLASRLGATGNVEMRARQEEAKKQEMLQALQERIALGKLNVETVQEVAPQDEEQQLDA